MRENSKKIPGRKDAPSGSPTTTPRRRCPICQKPTDPTYRPFCSRHCADVDLHRWLGGHYVIAGHADWEEDELPDLTSQPDKEDPQP